MKCKYKNYVKGVGSNEMSSISEYNELRFNFFIKKKTYLVLISALNILYLGGK